MKTVPGKKKPKQRVDESLKKAGKYEVTEDDTFDIRFGLINREGRWLITEYVSEDDEDSHEVVFRMWTFEEEVVLRQKSTAYDTIKKIWSIDQDNLNRLKVQRLLKSWTLDKGNNRLKLLHVDGILSDEGWAAFRKLHPNIVRFILNEMNKILEYNG